tara:strand:- start:12852 stop:13208 length:357 start_codon:yes stop_codon:yes gene_type:complete
MNGYQDKNNYDKKKMAKTSSNNAKGVKADEGKLLYQLIPTETTKGLAEVLTFGALKYAPDGWKTVPNAKDRYIGALMRHLEAYRSGEKIDPESGLPHIYHLVASASFIGYLDDNKLTP